MSKYRCSACSKVMDYTDLPQPRIFFLALDYTTDPPGKIYILCTCKNKAYEMENDNEQHRTDHKA